MTRGETVRCSWILELVGQRVYPLHASMGIQQLSDACLCCAVKVHSSLHERRVEHPLTVQCVFGDVKISMRMMMAITLKMEMTVMVTMVISMVVVVKVTMRTSGW